MIITCIYFYNYVANIKSFPLAISHVEENIVPHVESASLVNSISKCKNCSIFTDDLGNIIDTMGNIIDMSNLILFLKGKYNRSIKNFDEKLFKLSIAKLCKFIDNIPNEKICNDNNNIQSIVCKYIQKHFKSVIISFSIPLHNHEGSVITKITDLYFSSYTKHMRIISYLQKYYGLFKDIKITTSSSSTEIYPIKYKFQEIFEHKELLRNFLSSLHLHESIINNIILMLYNDLYKLILSFILKYEQKLREISPM